MQPGAAIYRSQITNISGNKNNLQKLCESNEMFETKYSRNIHNIHDKYLDPCPVLFAAWRRNVNGPAANFSFQILLEEFLPRPSSNWCRQQISNNHQTQSCAIHIFLTLLNNYHELDLKIKPHLSIRTVAAFRAQSKASNYNQFSHLSKEHK